MTGSLDGVVQSVSSHQLKSFGKISSSFHEKSASLYKIVQLNT